MVANMEMGENNILLSAYPPATGEVGCGAVAIAAAPFSCFFQSGLEFIKHSQVWFSGWLWHGQGVPQGPVWC